MTESIPRSLRRRINTERTVAQEHEPNVLEFDQAVDQIAQRIVHLLKDKSIVTALIFGYPNAGKSELSQRVTNEVERILGYSIGGGELKGYDQTPTDFGSFPAEIYLIQQVTYPLPNDYLLPILHRNAHKIGMPLPDFTVAITNPAITHISTRQLVGLADFVVHNPGSHKK